MNKPRCPKCAGTGWIYCQRCINGTPEGDRHFEQGGYVMGCAECGGHKRTRCDCDKGKELLKQIGGGHNTVSGLFGSWDTPENRAELARRYQEADKEPD